MKKYLSTLSIITIIMSTFFLVGCSDLDQQVQENTTASENNISEANISPEKAIELVDEKTMVSEGFQVGDLVTNGEYESDGSSNLPVGTYIMVSEIDSESDWFVDKQTGDVYYEIDSEGNIKKLDQDNYENKITQIFEDEPDSMQNDRPIKPGVTKENYNRINNNMTFAEVQSIFGVGEFVEESVSTKTYKWEGDTGGEVTISFWNHNKKVFSKMSIYLID